MYRQCIILVYLAIVNISMVFSQDKKWEGLFIGDLTLMKINSEDSLYIKGDFISSRGGVISIHNTGHLFLTGNLIDTADGLFQSSSFSEKSREVTEADSTIIAQKDSSGNGDLKIPRGHLYFVGDSLQSISSKNDISIWFSNVYVRNDVRLESSVRILDSLYLEKPLDLNGHDVYHYIFDSVEFTGNWGKLINESNTAYIYDSDTINKSGRIRMIKMIERFNDVDSMGLSIETNKQSANIKVDRMHHRDMNVTVGSIKRTYLIREKYELNRLGITYLDRDFDLSNETESDFVLWEVRTDTISPKALKFKSILDETRNHVRMSNDETLSDTIGIRRYTVASSECSYPPVIDLGSDTVVCSGNPVSFNAIPNEVDSPNGPFQYEWKRNGAVIQMGDDYSKSYLLKNITDAGTYTVKVTNSLGCESFDTVKVSLAIYPEPKIFVDSRITCESDPLTFWYADHSGEEITDVLWSFGDGTSGSDSSYIKIYQPECKNDTVKLLLTTDKGCSTEVDTIITVEQILLPRIEKSQILGDLKRRLIAVNDQQCKYTRQQITWYIDGELAGNQDTLEYIFPDYGEYVVQVKMEGWVCENETQDTIQIREIGIPKFSLSKKDYCVGEEIEIKNISQKNEGQFEYYWIHNGDKKEESNDQLKISFREAGIYQITLIMKEISGIAQGWREEYTDTVYVHANPVINFTDTFYYCKDQYTLHPEETQPHYTYQWTLEGTTNGTGETCVANTDGKYTLKVTNTLYQCVSEESTYVILNDRLRPQLGNDREACGSLALDAGYPEENCRWNTGESARSILVTESGTYQVEVRDEEGCEGSAEVNIIIHEIPDASLGEDLFICSNETFILQTPENADGSVYQWNTGSSEKAIPVASAGTYSVKVIHANGICESADTISVHVNEAPVIQLENEKYICNGQSVDLNLEELSFAELIQWTSPNGKVDSGTVLSVNEAGQYFVYVRFTSGCENKDSIQILEQETRAVADFLVASRIEAGDSVLFINRSYPEPLSYRWNFFESYFTDEENPAYVFYNPGTYNVTLTASDGSCPVTKTKEIIVTSRTKKIEEQDGEKVDMEGQKSGQGVFVDLLDAYAYPNPTNGKTKVYFKLTNKDNVKFTVISPMGKILHERRMEQVKEEESEFDFRYYTDGVYLIILSARNQQKIFKIVLCK